MAASGWHPSTFKRFVVSLATSTRAAIIDTDAGEAYLKGLGNPEGPHALACEWVGTRLANLFGLPTFDHAIMQIDATVDEIPLYGGARIESGPAYCTRKEPGLAWGGDAETLRKLENPQDIVRLVVFDTWIRNRDRHHPNVQMRRPNRDNVFLSSRGVESGNYRLLAIDHTHCFADGGTLNKRLRNIDLVQDTNVYGLFDEFRQYLNAETLTACIADLKAITREQIQQIVQSIPREWQVDQEAQIALIDFLIQRAQFVAETIMDRL